MVVTEAHPFYQHFASIYGARWEALYAALLKPERQVARQNLLAILSEERQRDWHSQSVGEDLPGCYWVPEAAKWHPERDTEGLLDVYIMDPGSVKVARALAVQAGDRVLDMCAAPGGKSLILIEALATEGEIFCNDLSAERRERLKKVIQQYVPRSVRDRVWVTGKDGVQFGLKEPEGFDRILLDAPCSGERHILENQAAQQEWSPRRTEHLAARQYALLSAAFLALKPGGRMVYSTCSISPAENDEVVARLIKKKKGRVRGVSAEPGKFGERTEQGVIYLPDQCGFGPLYFSILEKI
ncbi:MAG: RsmB/NOP family class I SAM-dependent RNA methyltransferase [Bdellovibrio sp.]